MTSVLWTAGQKITAANLNAMETAQLMTPSSSTTVANTASESALATVTIPANSATVGQVYRMRAWGTFGVTGTPTLSFHARLGGVGGTSIGSTGAQTIQSGVTARTWFTELHIAPLTTGSTATWFANYHHKMAGVLAGSPPFVNDTGEITTILDGTQTETRDSTIANDLVLTAQWSAASASNTITCFAFTTELLQ